MFKILDRYIIKKFLCTFFYALVLLISIIIVFDIQEKLDDFIEKKAPFEAILFDYYLNFAPYYANMFMFLFIFISVIFFTSKLAGNSEIIAILSAGVSFRRLLVPYFESAALLAGLSFFLSAYVIPPATDVMMKFEDLYVHNPYVNHSQNIHRQVDPNTFLYMQNYVTSSNVGYKFSWEKFDGNILKEKLMSEYIVWDSTKNKWTINNYYIRYFNGRPTQWCLDAKWTPPSPSFPKISIRGSTLLRHLQAPCFMSISTSSVCAVATISRHYLWRATNA